MEHVILVLMVLFLSVGLAYGMNYEVTKKAGEITPKMHRNYRVMGDNNMII